jgi:hypothetical protein
MSKYYVRYSLSFSLLEKTYFYRQRAWTSYPIFEALVRVELDCSSPIVDYVGCGEIFTYSLLAGC